MHCYWFLDTSKTESCFVYPKLLVNSAEQEANTEMAQLPAVITSGHLWAVFRNDMKMSWDSRLNSDLQELYGDAEVVERIWPRHLRVAKCALTLNLLKQDFSNILDMVLWLMSLIGYLTQQGYKNYEWDSVVWNNSNQYSRLCEAEGATVTIVTQQVFGFFL